MSDELQNQRTVTLEKLRLTVLHRVEEKLIDACVKCEEYEGFIYDAIDFKVTGAIYGERGEPLIIEYPESWIEAFKGRWFPAWLKRLFPVRLVSHCITTKTLYPYFRVNMPSIHNHLLRWDHRKTTLTDPLDEESLFQ